MFVCRVPQCLVCFVSCREGLQDHRGKRRRMRRTSEVLEGKKKCRKRSAPLWWCYCRVHIFFYINFFCCWLSISVSPLKMCGSGTCACVRACVRVCVGLHIIWKRMGKEAAEAQAVGQRLPSERCVALRCSFTIWDSPPCLPDLQGVFGSLALLITFCIVLSDLGYSFGLFVPCNQPTNQPTNRKRREENEAVCCYCQRNVSSMVLFCFFVLLLGSRRRNTADNRSGSFHLYRKDYGPQYWTQSLFLIIHSIEFQINNINKSIVVNNGWVIYLYCCFRLRR